MGNIEAELAKEKSVLSNLTAILDGKERSFEELKRTMEQFQQRYSKEVAQKQAELDRLNAELDELLVKRVPYVHDQKHKSPVIEPPSGRFTGSAGAFNSEGGFRPEFHTAADLKEAKRLYRKIASIIHPDKAKDARSRPLRTKLMAELNEAYVLKDIHGMKHILGQWYESPEAVAGEDAAAELVRTERAIVHIKKRISEIEAGTSKIMSSELYVMMVNVQEAERAGRDILAEMTTSIDAKIKDAKNRLVLRMYA